MSTTVAAVKFEGTEKSYFYGCDITDLVQGDKVTVNADGKDKTVTFVGYIPSELIGFKPSRKVLGRVKLEVKHTGVRTRVGTIRSKLQRETEARELRMLLQASHPTMLSTKEIADAMGWELKSTPAFVKISITLEDKITQAYKGWYTSKL